MAMSRTRVGVIGVGSISKSHLDAYRDHPDVEIVALSDVDESLLHERGATYGVKALYTDHRQMLAEASLDAVSVCTWNSQHAPCTIDALGAGVHVLCEKPMATNAADALRMQQAAEKSDKLLMIGFVRRFGNDCDILREFIDSDTFGEIYHAKAVYLRRKGNPGSWFGDKARAGGGPLIDLGVHVIDMTRYLMGNPKPVSVYGATFQKLFDRRGVRGKPSYVAARATSADVCDVEDFATAMIRYDNGAVVHVDASFSLNIKEDIGRIELYGTKAGAVLSPELEIFTELGGHMVNIDLETPTALSFQGLFDNEIRHFIKCVRNGEPCRNPAEDGVTIMRILDAIYESAKTGHEVRL